MEVYKCLPSLHFIISYDIIDDGRVTAFEYLHLKNIPLVYRGLPMNEIPPHRAYLN